jgi:hypothetical protein
MGSAGLAHDRKFDLLSQPFWVLGIDPTTALQEVQAALNNGQTAASAADVSLAVEALCDPDRRLLCELAYPLDCAEPEIAHLYAALAASSATTDLLRFSDRLWPLARANFLTHIASQRPATGELLYEIVRSHAAIDSADIDARVRTARTRAGLSAPTFLSINQGLLELRKIHSEAVFTGYSAIEDAAQPMLECALKAMASDERNCDKALTRLLRCYRQATESSRLNACRGIESAGAALLREPTSRAAMAQLNEAAKTWTSLSRPLLLWNADRPRRKLTLDTPIASLRWLVGRLCESRQYEVAAAVMAGTREIFAAVPTTLDELAEDARVLATLSVHTSITQLKSAIQDAENDVGPLIAALERTGFGDKSAEPAAGLWNAFVGATRSSTSPNPSPWQLIHKFVLHLSNRPGAGAAVVALIEGLIKYGESTAAPPRILTGLRDNLHFMQSFVGDAPTLERPAVTRAEANQPSKITKLSKAILGTFRATPASEPCRHEAGWRKPLFGISMAVILALFVPAFYLGFGRLPMLSAATGQAALGAEAMPQVGTGQHLSLEGVRYCHFQKERLRLIKQMIKRTEDARSFNLLIVDYNSRCSDFFYKEEDLHQVEAEVTANNDILQADARRIVASWPEYKVETSSNN